MMTAMRRPASEPAASLQYRPDDYAGDDITPAAMADKYRCAYSDLISLESLVASINDFWILQAIPAKAAPVAQLD